MKFGYRRVSTADQSLDRQDLGNDLDRVFEEHISGKDRDRPQLERMLSLVEEGDEVRVWSIDRLARDLRDLLEIVQTITGRGATIRFLSDNLAFSGGQDDHMAQLQLNILGAVAQFERQILKRRQAEGIQKAKERGAYKGGKARIDRASVYQLLDQGLGPRQVAQALRIHEQSVYRLKRERATATAGE
ncbi:Site-specific DNA recombinase [Roseivivax halotolerans]|uniref:Site-specific DNA recombinase n=1 Tax=Roseivivax halotolerans TaxID=93684 RepID=A0A1I6AKL5_9RHOB|nr:recombinase family protein [Roseivivax halotolerans]SFQ69180.1 Site-specific DNA recombinase [Roseivivax halotolerans]